MTGIESGWQRQAIENYEMYFGPSPLCKQRNLFDLPAEEEKETLYGWRVMSISTGESLADGFLVGLWGYPWRSRELKAVCTRKYHFLFKPQSDGSACINPLCDCGIYVLKREPKDYYVRVLCTMWGRVLEYDDGYKAEYCRMEKIFLPHSLIEFYGKHFEQLYQIPVEESVTKAEEYQYWPSLLSISQLGRV